MSKHKKINKAAKKSKRAQQSKSQAKKSQIVVSAQGPVPVTIPATQVAAPVVTPVVPPSTAGTVLGRRWNRQWLFALFSVAVLALTTVFWTVLTARLHQANADQLVDSYLFESIATLQGAGFPGAHSFLIKWPVFGLMQLYGYSTNVFIAATIGMVLVTVGSLAYVLHRIERRPIPFGLMCLAMSSILLLVPAQPYAGALLPVNMAMTTTRNLEYALLLVALFFGLKARQWKSWRFAISIVLVGLIVASDKLFIVLAIGGGLAAAAWYGLVRRQKHPAAAAGWVVAASTLGVALSALLLGSIQGSGLARIVGDQAAVPYTVGSSVKELATGLFFAVTGLLTNLGANPVYDTGVIKDVPAALVRSLQQPSIVGYIINAGLAGAALWAAIRVAFDKQPDIWSRLSVTLLGATAASFVVFSVTDHYYPVDSRYLTVVFFALAVAAASYGRRLRVRPRLAAATALVLLVAIPIGISASLQQFHASELAMEPRTAVTSQVSRELTRRNIGRLAGDYWDVTPVKSAASQKLTIMPVDSCSVPRPALSSNAWFKAPASAPAAYLAVRDGSPEAGPEHRSAGPGSAPTYGGCTLAKVVGEYGVPAERVPVTKDLSPIGTSNALLLLYPNGFQRTNVKKLQEKLQAATPAVPEIQSLIPLSEKNACTKGTTLQVIAHEDDDLLFMNPDTQASITEGRCVRTVYVTAGDAGAGLAYWSSREQGAKAAYAQMFGVANEWQDDRQILRDRQVAVSYLKAAPTVSLIFLRLPDGSLRGEGFASTGHQSLTGLNTNRITIIASVEPTPVTYSRQDIVASLREIMIKDLPDLIRTQSSADLNDGDHADHHAVGLLTVEAAASYIQPHQVTRYMGYPEQYLPVNLSDDDITHKFATFLTYAKFDGAVCQTAFECQGSHTYGRYLTRKYLP